MGFCIDQKVGVLLQGFQETLGPDVPGICICPLIFQQYHARDWTYNIQWGQEMKRIVSEMVTETISLCFIFPLVPPSVSGREAVSLFWARTPSPSMTHRLSGHTQRSQVLLTYRNVFFMPLAQSLSLGQSQQPCNPSSLSILGLEAWRTLIHINS